MNKSLANSHRAKFSAKPTIRIDSKSEIMDDLPTKSPTFRRDEAIDIAKACIEYLNNDKFILHDTSFVGGGISALLRTTVLGNASVPGGNVGLASLTLDTRRLLLSLQKEKGAWSRTISNYDTQPQVILNAAFQLLRDLEGCLWDEIYKDILNISDGAGEDLSQMKQSVADTLSSLPTQSFELAKSFFKFINKYYMSKSKILSSISSSDLAIIVAPLIFRPKKSAFMSIRHVEDTRKIRPIVSFLIEKAPEVYTRDFKSISVPTTPQGKLKVDLKVDLQKASQNLSDHIISESPYASPRSSTRNLVLPTLSLVDRDSTGPLMDIIPNSPSSEMKSIRANINRMEWKIIESLAMQNIVMFLKSGNDWRSTSSQSVKTSSLDSDDSHDDFKLSKEISVTAGVYAYKSPPSSDTAMFSFAGDHCETQSNSAVNNSSSTISGFKREPGIRRRMIAECKAIRNQILQFEQEYRRKYGREPRSSERGHMNVVYANYRDMKRSIRDISAVDIQRFSRGYLTRRNLRQNRRYSEMDNDTTDSPSSATLIGDSTMDDVIVKYRDLQNQKKEVKKLLKRFDEEFTATHGRSPKKADKEVMRPMYQNYHELKVQVDELKKVIDARSSNRVDDAKEEDRRSSTDVDMDEMEEDAKAVSPRSRWAFGQQLSADQLTPTYIRNDSTSSSNGLDDKASTSHHARTEIAEKDRQYAALQEEKRNLHLYLKAYERDFNATHGRPVMKQEDIQPVANEYQRYKELKSIIKDLKGS